VTHSLPYLVPQSPPPPHACARSLDLTRRASRGLPHPLIPPPLNFTPDGLDNRLGKFPDSLEPMVLGRVDENGDSEKREAEVIRSIIKQVRRRRRRGWGWGGSGKDSTAAGAQRRRRPLLQQQRSGGGPSGEAAAAAAPSLARLSPDAAPRTVVRRCCRASAGCTQWASFTATSSPTTCSSPPMGRSRSSTLARRRTCAQVRRRAERGGGCAGALASARVATQGRPHKHGPAVAPAQPLQTSLATPQNTAMRPAARPKSPYWAPPHPTPPGPYRTPPPGINFNPLYGMLDPRYSPPEELIMPQSERGGTRARVKAGQTRGQRAHFLQGTVIERPGAGHPRSSMRSRLTPAPRLAPAPPPSRSVPSRTQPAAGRAAVAVCLDLRPP
jgi:hypothetical protein